MSHFPLKVNNYAARDEEIVLFNDNTHVVGEGLGGTWCSW